MYLYSSRIQSNLFIPGAILSCLILWLLCRGEEVRPSTFSSDVSTYMWCFQMRHLHSFHTVLQLSVPYCINPRDLRCVSPRHRTVISARWGFLALLSDTGLWLNIQPPCTKWCTYYMQVHTEICGHGAETWTGQIINAASQSLGISNA